MIDESRVNEKLSSTDGVALAAAECDTFSTTSAPLNLHPALDQLLQPDGLLAEVLAYAGPAGVSKLRSFPLFRQRMARLNSGDLLRSGLLFRAGDDEEDGVESQDLRQLAVGVGFQGPPSKDTVNVLRGVLLERAPIKFNRKRPAANLLSANNGGLVMLRGRPDWRDHRLTILGLLALAQCPRSSERCLGSIVRHLKRNGPMHPDHINIAKAVAENPASSGHVLEDLFKWDRCRTEEAQCLTRLDRNWEFNNDAILCAIAENENASPRLLRLLVDTVSVAVWAALAKSERISPDILAALAYPDQHDSVLIAVGRNPCTPKAVLEKLSSSAYRVEAREAVASNPSTPPNALRALASSSSDSLQIRMALSCNESLPADALLELSRDEHWTVRRNVAQHSHADPSVLRALLNNREETHWVRLGAAWNSNLTAEEVASSLDATILSDAKILALTSRDSGLLDRLVRDPPGGSGETVRRDVAGNVFASEETLAYLWGCPDSRVRTIVALNPQTPPSTLKNALFHDIPHVRAVAVRNPRTAPEWLLRLVTAEAEEEEDTALALALDEEVAEAVAVDDKATGECLAALYRRVRAMPNPPVRERLCECLAMNPHTPPSILAKLANSESVEVRAAVASHPRLPVQSLARLSECGERSVVSGVTRNTLVQVVADHVSCVVAA